MRIQLELNDRGKEILDEIRSAIGEKRTDRRMSHRELFDYAITFLHWGIKERQKNRIIASLDEREKNYKELIMPIFKWVIPTVKAEPVLVAVDVPEPAYEPISAAEHFSAVGPAFAAEAVSASAAAAPEAVSPVQPASASIAAAAVAGKKG